MSIKAEEPDALTYPACLQEQASCGLPVCGETGAVYTGREEVVFKGTC